MSFLGRGVVPDHTIIRRIDAPGPRGFNQVKLIDGKRMRGRVAAVIERLARQKTWEARRAQGDARTSLLHHAAHLRERAALCRTVTPHWRRHNAASHTTMRGKSDTAIQKSAGWPPPP